MTPAPCGRRNVAAIVAFVGAPSVLGGCGARTPMDLFDVALPGAEPAPVAADPDLPDASPVLGDASLLGLPAHVVLFGGAAWNSEGEGTPLGDTWTWDGTAWTQLSVTGPPARQRASAALYQNEMLLFGGDPVTSSYFSDAWTFDGGAWTRIVPGPPPLDNALMGAVGGDVVLFEGIPSGIPFSADGYSFDGAAWSLLMATLPGIAPSYVPGGLSFQTAVTWNGQFIVVGSIDAGNDVSSATWAFDGTTWAELDDGQNLPPGRYGATLAALGGSLVLFGGSAWDGTQPRNDTWIFDGRSWTEVQSAGPTPRARSLASVGTVRETMMLFGGNGADGVSLGDTWEFDGTSWTERDVPGPSARASAATVSMPVE